METPQESLTSLTAQDGSNATPNASLTPNAPNDSLEGIPQQQADDCNSQFDSVDEKGRLRSFVWNHFTKKVVNGDLKAECHYCSKQLNGKPSSGTTHLRNHYRICVRRKYYDAQQKTLAKGIGKKEEGQKLVTYTFNQETSRKELANAIILHEYPLFIVEHVGFRRYSNSLQPCFKVPSWNTIRSDIFKIYDYERSKTMHKLEMNYGRVAITTDMWTSSHQNKGFMAITAHFIDDEWKLQSRILRFAYVPCPHTKEVLVQVLIDSLMDWNVDTNLSTIIVDNCSTNDAMLKMLSKQLEISSGMLSGDNIEDAMMTLVKDKLQPTSLILNGSLIHMRCCAHILNLIVKDGLAVIKDEIENIRDSVLYWTATPKREKKFLETARHLHISTTKKLGLDCPTRWNSTYLMIKTALIYKDVFPCLKQRESQYKCLPSDSDWELAKIICDKLELFYEITKSFSGTKYPTTNIYFAKICKIRVELVEWLACPIEMVSQMAFNMLEKFDKYWGSIHGLMGVAVVLDPQYKMALLEYYLPKVYGSDYEVQLDRICCLCYDLVTHYSSKMKGSSMTAASNQGSIDASISSLCSLDDFDSYVLQNKKSKTSHARTELDHYLEEEVLPRRSDFDILAWWKVQGGKYPILQSIARDLLAIPVSTVALESAFSTSGRLVSPHRSRLHPKTLEALMCAQNWLWAAENEGGGTLASDNYATILEEADDDDGDCSVVQLE